jgi:hypothetical protein
LINNTKILELIISEALSLSLTFNDWFECLSLEVEIIEQTREIVFFLVLQ